MEKDLLKEYKKGNIKLSELHYDDMYMLDISGVYHEIQPVIRLLKSATTDKVEKTYHLSRKSLGHQAIILLGLGIIDTKGKKVKSKK